MIDKLKLILKTDKLQNKFLIPLVIFMLVGGSMMYFLIFNFIEDRLEEELHHSFAAKQADIQSAAQQLAEHALSHATLYARMPDVISAYEKANSGNIKIDEDPTVQQARENLRSFMKPVIAGFEQSYPGQALKIHFHLRSNRSFLRSWRQSQQLSGSDKSDDLSTFRESVAVINFGSHAPVKGIEIGRGGFAIRGLAAVSNNEGKHLGSVEMLYDFNSLVTAARSNEDQNFAVYMNKSKLAIATKLQNQKKNPLVGDDFVFITSTAPELSNQLVTPDILKAGVKNSSGLFYSGSECIQSFPIKDFRKRQIGVMVYFQNIAESQSAIAASKWFMAGGVFLLIVVISGLIVWLIRKTMAPVADIVSCAEALAVGDVQQNIAHHSDDEIGALANSFRKTIESQKKVAAIAAEIAKGNLNFDFQPASERDELGNAVITMQKSLQEMSAELKHTIQQQIEGNIDAECDPGKFHGVYADLMESINKLLISVTNPMVEVSDILQEYAMGDLSLQMRELPGKQKVLSDGVNSIRKNLLDLTDESHKLAQAAAAGDLELRGDADRFSGKYRELISNINATFENVAGPLAVTVDSVQALATGDLTHYIGEDFVGNYAELKSAFNAALDAMNQLISEAQATVEQVNDGAKQVSDSSNSVSNGATEQASSLEETSASMAEIGSQAKTNAESAAEANKLAENASDAAEQGNESMHRMLEAMNEINASSTQISKIIKVIDEIAFQTNLLALNAAVEAARAGVHGKGFAVVAEEVRNLAQRSAKAARETTELIEGSTRKVNNGTAMADEAAGSLHNIIEDINQMAGLMAEVTVASKDQVNAIDQINNALEQIDQVTQASTAYAEESASASTDLSDRAARLFRLLSRFRTTAARQNAQDGLSFATDSAEHPEKVEIQSQHTENVPAVNFDIQIEDSEKQDEVPENEPSILDDLSDF